MVVIRTFDHNVVQALCKKASSIPVINGLTDYSHPCQACADILTVFENFNQLFKLVIVYFGDPNNVFIFYHKWPKFLIFSLFYPHLKNLENYCLMFFYEKNPIKAVQGAHVIYTDTWASMELNLIQYI